MAPMTWGIAQVIGSGGIWHTGIQVLLAAAAGGAVYVAVLYLLGSDDLVLVEQLRGRGAAHRGRGQRLGTSHRRSLTRTGANPSRRPLPGRHR